MLNLPPVLAATDAALGVRLSDQVRRLGSAGFPLVLFRGGSLDPGAQWEELQRALFEARENGGWPALCVAGDSGLGLRAMDAGHPPWGLLLEPSGSPPEAPELVLGTCAEGRQGWARLDRPWGFAGLGPCRARPASTDFRALQQGCLALRGKGIAPIALDVASLQDARRAFRAGAVSVVMGRELQEAPEPAELLWQAQRLRWRAAPPLARGQGLALIGGSGSGKSTLARRLGQRLGLPVQDLDEAIVRQAGKPIPRIFAEEGEARFRELESEATCRAFAAPAILALGGGAWEDAAVREAAQASGFAVLWLAEEPGRIWRRVARDPGRPLAQERQAFLARWATRMPHWMEAPALLTLGRSPGRLAEALVRDLA